MKRARASAKAADDAAVEVDHAKSATRRVKVKVIPQTSQTIATVTRFPSRLHPVSIP